MSQIEPVSHRKATALLIDDHQLIRTGLRLTLEMSARIGEIFESGSIQEAISSEAKRAYSGDIDLVLLDIMMPGLNGLDGLAVIQSAFPSAKVVMVSAAGDSAVVRDAAERGACGFILKSSASADISRAVDTVLAGGWFFPEESQARLRGALRSDSPLTPQQLEILEALCRGLSNRAIASEKGLSENTVRVHVGALLQKLNAKSRSEAVYTAFRLGIVQAQRA